MLSCDDKADLAHALCATAETLGYALSAKAAELMADDLADYSVNDLAAALRACRRELTGKLSIAAILQRVQAADGRPEPNEAWALALSASDESETVILTDEIQRAMSASGAVLEAGDKIGARMAFIAAYQRLVDVARRDTVPVKWNLSLGTDQHRRVTAVESAVRLGRLTQQSADKYIKHIAQEPVTADGAAIAGLLTGKTYEQVNDEVRAKLKAIRESVAAGQDDREESRRKQIEERRREHDERLAAHLNAVASLEGGA